MLSLDEKYIAQEHIETFLELARECAYGSQRWKQAPVGRKKEAASWRCIRACQAFEEFLASHDLTNP